MPILVKTWHINHLGPQHTLVFGADPFRGTTMSSAKYAGMAWEKANN